MSAGSRSTSNRSWSSARDVGSFTPTRRRDDGSKKSGESSTATKGCTQYWHASGFALRYRGPQPRRPIPRCKRRGKRGTPRGTRPSEAALGARGMALRRDALGVGRSDQEGFGPKRGEGGAASAAEV